MDAITPEEARAYFRRWQLLREEEARQLARTPMETKLRQLVALMASRHLFGVEPDREWLNASRRRSSPHSLT